MFPTYVGMNRRRHDLSGEVANVPHVCGNEPQNGTREASRAGMFPTYVGMNRLSESSTSIAEHVPHVCGDEPVAHLRGLRASSHNDVPHVCGDEPEDDVVLGELCQCSPRMWG